MKNTILTRIAAMLVLCVLFLCGADTYGKSAAPPGEHETCITAVAEQPAMNNMDFTIYAIAPEDSRWRPYLESTYLSNYKQPYTRDGHYRYLDGRPDALLSTFRLC